MFKTLKHWLAGGGLQARPKKKASLPRIPRKEPGVRPRPVSRHPSTRGIVAPRPAEQPCPHCGEPMLAGWGSTCGNCRPGLAVPKTLCLSASDRPGLAPARGLSLGWLFVTQSPDVKRQGTLIELTAPISVLSRGAGPASAGQEWFDFADDFMSMGHALIHRPPSSEDRASSFTIRDRQNPGPSANGTFVNSNRLAPGEILKLSEGDIIRLGVTEFVFKSLWLPPTGSRPI